MAVQRFLFMSDQQVLDDVNLRCDIPLDQQLPVKLVGPVYMPDGPNINRVNATWSFGFEGYFSHPFEARGTGDLLSLRGFPAREGVLADLTWDLRGGSYTGSFSPLTESRLRAQDDLTRTITLPPLLDVPEPVSPQPGGVILNQEVRWQSSGPFFPDAYVVTLRDERGMPVWTFITPFIGAICNCWPTGTTPKKCCASVSPCNWAGFRWRPCRPLPATCCPTR